VLVLYSLLWTTLIISFALSKQSTYLGSYQSGIRCRSVSKMEALVTLSLAANIAQFVDLASKLILGAKEVYESGTGMTEESAELDNITNSMKLISLKLDPSSTGQQSDDDQALRRLADDCRVLSKHLGDLLQKVTPNNQKRKREAVVSILQYAWTRRDRLELERRLDNCRSQLELQLQFMTRYPCPEYSSRNHSDICEAPI
jgi:hypothetical protein